VTVSIERLMVDCAGPVKGSISLGLDLGTKQNLDRISVFNTLDFASPRVFSIVSFFSCLLLASPELSDTHVYGP